MSIGLPWSMRHKGVLNAYSMLISYEVPNSLEYFTMLGSFLSVLGIALHIQCRGVSSLILQHLITKSDYFETIQEYFPILAY